MNTQMYSYTANDNMTEYDNAFDLKVFASHVAPYLCDPVTWLTQPCLAQVTAFRVTVLVNGLIMLQNKQSQNTRLMNVKHWLQSTNSPTAIVWEANTQVQLVPYHTQVHSNLAFASKLFLHLMIN